MVDKIFIDTITYTNLYLLLNSLSFWRHLPQKQIMSYFPLLNFFCIKVIIESDSGYKVVYGIENSYTHLTANSLNL